VQIIGNLPHIDPSRISAECHLALWNANFNYADREAAEAGKPRFRMG